MNWVRLSARILRSTSSPSTLGSFKSSRIRPGGPRRRCLGEELFQGLGSVTHHGDLVDYVVFLQGPQCQRLVVRVILYQQDGGLSQGFLRV